MDLISIATIAGIIVGLLIFIGLIMARLYKRATREMSLVKTGSGGAQGHHGWRYDCGAFLA